MFQDSVEDIDFDPFKCQELAKGRELEYLLTYIFESMGYLIVLKIDLNIFKQFANQI